MIKGYDTTTGITEELRRLDHVWFSVPHQGGKAALELKETQDIGGYNLLHALHDQFSLPVSDIPAVDATAENLGTLWHFEEEDLQVVFHGIYNHGFEIGWHQVIPELVTRHLDEWWEEHEDEVVRPMRIAGLGGVNLSKISPNLGFRGPRWTHRNGWGHLAQSEAEFAVFFDPDDD